MAVRLGHALYWCLAVLAALIVLFAFTGFRSPELALVAFGFIVYGLGYAIRYVLTGIKRPF